MRRPIASTRVRPGFLVLLLVVLGALQTSPRGGPWSRLGRRSQPLAASLVVARPARPLAKLSPSGAAVTRSDTPLCATDTLFDYLDTTCTLPDTTNSNCTGFSSVTYTWNSQSDTPKGYTCTGTNSVCMALDNGKNITMFKDTSCFTILVGQTTAWNVPTGESVTVTVTGTVQGAVANWNWPHFDSTDSDNDEGRGQTGDGLEENKTTVSCGMNCSDTLKGISDIPCNASVPNSCPSGSTCPTTAGNYFFCFGSNAVETCTMLPNCLNTPYLVEKAKFTTGTSPYPLEIKIQLDGGTNGSANLYSVGLHLCPVTNMCP